MNTYKAFDVVVVPFPFTNSTVVKLRPAIVLSSDKYFNHSVHQTILAMVTSSNKNSWPLDFVITDLNSCGLKEMSLIRLKLFTLDNRLIKAKIGRLSKKDQNLFKENLALVFNDFLY